MHRRSLIPSKLKSYVGFSTPVQQQNRGTHKHGLAALYWLIQWGKLWSSNERLVRMPLTKNNNSFWVPWKCIVRTGGPFLRVIIRLDKTSIFKLVFNSVCLDSELWALCRLWTLTSIYPPHFISEFVSFRRCVFTLESRCYYDRSIEFFWILLIYFSQWAMAITNDFALLF